MTPGHRTLALALLLVAGCLTDPGDELPAAGTNAGASTACQGESGGYECASFCGSDVVGARVCVDGEWRCPDGMVDGYRDCPPGTCFGPPTRCCDADGNQYAPFCAPYEGGLRSAGDCPAGTQHCGWQGFDAGPDVPPPDFDAGLAACLDGGEDCALCCDKYRSPEQDVAFDLLRACACAGPCSAACRAEGSYCEGTGPSSSCTTCLVGLLQADSTACAGEIADCRARGDCAPWLDCRAKCP
jgi:hypothetical protein